MNQKANQKKSIILIGMPGSGKSTVGVLLAKALCMQFLDTDIVIQRRANMKLQQIINDYGIEAFEKKEEAALLSLQQRGQVIATGGSAVFYPAAMTHLKTLGTVIYIKISVEKLKKRIWNPKTRGIVFKPGQDFEGLYEERRPLYEKYADISVESDESSADDMIERVLKVLKDEHIIHE